MFLRRLSDFILASRLNSMGSAFLVSLVPGGSSFGFLAATFVTLCRGAAEGSQAFLAVLAGSVASTLLYRLSGNFQLFGQMVWMVFVFGLASALSALLLRRTGSWALVTELGAIAGVLLIGLLHLCYPDLHGWWASQLTDWFRRGTSVMGHFMPAGGSALPDRGIPLDTATLTGISAFAWYATGILVASFLLNLFLQLMLARAWEAALFQPGSFGKEMRAFRPARITALLLLVLLSLAVLAKSQVALDMLPVLLMVFCVAGFCLMHALVARMEKEQKGGGKLVLWLLYGGVVLLFPFSLAIMAVAALLDIALDFRQKRIVKMR